ncbi:hypothetical protein WOSG25_120370 [Weissella oryzae SG25]|uniref:DNA-directed RNA polymerase beta subunit n=1 Tax=Weissella oryzae (strain DSM 25784 / JCM 18191 / LMG 30913 / SG25) TaxID=1329250 RepID=A0A069CV05_WEIOS|nr:hypothetical protein [Weissella oryzae]GAK31645.1 hypothetical protein WOSG25_120370 [Weissella oryzae SG25]
MDKQHQQNISAYQKAQTFFEERYYDRGMVKWLGYYLSDHTEQIAKEQAYNTQIKARSWQTAMTEIEITALLFKAYRQRLKVDLQVKLQSIDGTLPALVSGIVQGYDENNFVFIGTDAIKIDDIQWVGFHK